MFNTLIIPDNTTNFIENVAIPTLTRETNIYPILEEGHILETEKLEEIAGFFAALHGNAPGYVSIWAKKSSPQFFTTSQLTKAANACWRMVDRGQDVYFGVGLREKDLSVESDTARGGNDDVSVLPGLWVDIDILGPKHKSQNLPKNIDESLKIIANLPFEPSIIVNSGGGLHVYWLFKEPWVLRDPDERELAKQISVGFQRMLRQEAEKYNWDLDPTADFARVLRVPNTVNYKIETNPRKVTILRADYSRRYALEELLEHIEVEPEKKNAFNKELSIGPGNAEDILTNCKFIQHCKDNSNSLSEPHWHTMITILHEVEGGKDLIHKLSDNYPGGSAYETDRKIDAVERTGMPCNCAYVKDQLGFKCPEVGCKVVGPISFANNATVVARLRINELLPKILVDPKLCFESETLRWLAVLDRNDPAELGIIKQQVQGKVSFTDLSKAIKHQISLENRKEMARNKGYFSRFSYSDTGNAERFVALYGDNIKYCNQTKRWYLWDEKRWVEDSAQQVRVLATRSINEVNKRAISELKGDILDEVAKWCEKSKSNTLLKAMVEISQYGSGIPVKITDFDIDPYLLNCQNGTLNLKTGKLQPHCKEDLISRIIPVDYDPEAKCPVWDKFVAEALTGDKEAIKYLAKIVGISLTGILLKIFFFIYGPSNTGKSKFVELVHFLIGEYGKGLSIDTLMLQKYGGGGGPRPELFRLQGSRAVFASETTDGRPLDAALLKRLIGGDVVTERTLYGEPVDFIPFFKLWIHGNYKPDVQGDDSGIWNRLVLIPFSNVVPVDQQDPDLLDKLKAELPGILAWAVRGCQEWILAGEKIPDTPERFKKEGEEYQNSMDTLGQFIEEICIIEPNEMVSPSILYSIYRAWSEGNGTLPLKAPKFANRLKERGYEQDRNKKQRFWKGINVQAIGQPHDTINDLSAIAIDQLKR